MQRTTAITSTFKLLFLVSASGAISSAWAQASPTSSFLPLRGNYMLYSLGIGDPMPARRDDSKVALEITGEAARKMFDAMWPDTHNLCTDGSGIRIREKENLSCQREKDGSHRCSFGFDLRTGKGIKGNVC